MAEATKKALNDVMLQPWMSVVINSCKSGTGGS